MAVTRKTLLNSLTLHRLKLIAKETGIINAKANKSELISILVSTRRATTEEILAYFHKPELKTACINAGLNSSGNTKATLVSRLLESKEYKHGSATKRTYITKKATSKSKKKADKDASVTTYRKYRNLSLTDLAVKINAYEGIKAETTPRQLTEEKDLDALWEEYKFRKQNSEIKKQEATTRKTKESRKMNTQKILDKYHKINKRSGLYPVYCDACHTLIAMISKKSRKHKKKNKHNICNACKKLKVVNVPSYDVFNSGKVVSGGAFELGKKR